MHARAWCCTTVGYEDAGRLRPVLHRAALSEMVVPYGHPGGGHFRKNAFDVGEIRHRRAGELPDPGL